MRIQVLREFAGKLTNERRIYPGVYDERDERLCGIGQYLLDNGFAVELDPTTIVEVEATSDDAGLTGYDAMTVEELRAECEARGIDLDEVTGSGARGKLVKSDYVAVLERGDGLAAQDAIEFNGRTLVFNPPDAD